METQNHLAWYTKTLREYISMEELKPIMQKSDIKGFLEIAHTWAWIAFALTLPLISDALFHKNIYLKVFSIILSLFILGGKQLACAIIMHDASHDSIFETRKLNTFIGNWFGAYPIFQNTEQYRPYHREHHIYTGLEKDPDVNLTKGYPTSAISMTRKFLRDLSGATGVKSQIAVIAMHLQILQYSLGNVAKRLYLPWTKERFKTMFSNLIGPIVWHGFFSASCIFSDIGNCIYYGLARFLPLIIFRCEFVRWQNTATFQSETIHTKTRARLTQISSKKFCLHLIM